MIDHDCHEYVEDLRRSIPSRVHPAGRVWIEEWLDEMHNAADYGDMAAFAKLAQRVQEKIELELRWHQESLDSATPKRG